MTEKEPENEGLPPAKKSKDSRNPPSSLGASPFGLCGGGVTPHLFVGCVVESLSSWW